MFNRNPFLTSSSRFGQALAWLVERRLLLREERIGVASTFRLNPTRTADAERLLQDIESHAPATRADGDNSVSPPDRSSDRGPVHNPSDLMRKALAWVDAVLLRYHRRNQPTGGDLPGLTRSHASVDTALSTRVVQPTTTPLDPGDDVDVAERDLNSALEQAPDDDTLAALYRRLALTPLEFRAVLLCLAPDVDAKYQGVYGVLNDDLGRRTATLGVLCAVLGDPADVRCALAQSAAIPRWALTDHGAAFPYADQPLRLDAALLAWLLADRDALLADQRLSAVVRADAWRGAEWIAAAAGPQIVSDLLDELAAVDDYRWIVLEDGDIDGSRAAVEAASTEIGRRLVRLELRVANPADAAEIAVRATRASRADERRPRPGCRRSRAGGSAQARSTRGCTPSLRQRRPAFSSFPTCSSSSVSSPTSRFV